MAHSVIGASLDGIYTRLNGTPQYHPLDAQTFADWTVEAGDVVRFQRGNVNYDSPVHSTKVVWRGTPQVTVSSTGTKEREPVSKVSRKKYGRGGNAVRANEGINSYVSNMEGNIYTYIEQTASYIMDHVGARTGAKVYTGLDEPVEDPENPFVDGDLWIEGSLLNTWDDMEDIPWEDSDPEAHEYDWLQLSGQVFHVWKDGKWDEAADGTKFAEYTDFVRTKDRVMSVARNVERVDGEIRSNIARLDVRADSISSSVRQNSNSIGEIGSRITQTATSIRQEVSNKTSQLQSSIQVEADKISLVVESTAQGNKIKPAQIVAAINDGESSILISANHVNLDGYVKATDITADYIKGKIASISSVSMQSLVATNIQFSVGGGLYGNPANAIMNLQLYQSGNSYQIWGAKFNGEIVKTSSFSRAVSSWDWTGGNGQVKVTAQPQNQTLGVDVRVNGDATITSNGTYTYKVQYEDNNGSYWDTGATKSVVVDVPSHNNNKGANWYCTITQSGTGKSCSLTKNFAASESIPFSNGSYYHLYT